MSPAHESHLQRYDLLERIATGGMAEVFLAKARGAHGFEKTLAIKRILPELAADPEFEAHFIAEAKVAAGLDHANIVYVHDFGRLPSGSLFIAMEYVDGVDLAELLRRHRERGTQVPLAAAFHIAIAMASGLDYAHRKGVIHRDVSPSNILLSRAGEIKLADFGIALAASQHMEQPAQRHRIMGKWRYMSPEQTRGEPLAPSSDIFTMGAVLYELFSGHKLFAGERPDEVIASIHDMPIPRIWEQRAELPARLGEVLCQALQRDPRARFGRAAQLQRALTEISYESGIVASALEAAEIVSAVKHEREPVARPAARLGGVAAGRGLDELIRLQLEDARPATERRTVVDDERPPTEVMDEQAPAAERNSTSDSSVTSASPAAGAAEATEDTAGGRLAGEVAHVRRMSMRALLGPAAALLGVLAMIALGLVLDGSPGPAPVPVSALAVPDAAIPVGLTADAGVPDASAADARTMSELHITSTPPGAELWLDGALLAQRTPQVVSVEPGAHHLELRRDGHLPFVVQDIHAKAGQSVPVEATMVEGASLTVVTEPGDARIFVDGEPRGLTPVTMNELAPGKLKVVVSKPGHRTVSRVVTVEQGADLRLHMALAPIRYGRVDIHIQGSWADIFENDQRIGRAPIKGLKLTAGRHRLTFRNPATGKRRTYWVEVVAGASKYYSFSLD